MRSRSRTKEEIAVGDHAAAVGAAQCPEVYPTLSAEEAHLIVSKVRLGKHSILFRIGHDPAERKEAVDELATMLKRDPKRRRRPLSWVHCRAAAATALDELTLDMCATCSGAGEVRDHDLKLEGKQPMKVCPTCMGSRRRRYNEDQRVAKLASELAAAWGYKEEGDAAILRDGLRDHPRLRDLLVAIDQARGILIQAEGVAVEETARTAGILLTPR